jgi:Na+/H+-dicarboxylate symporter
MKKMSSGTQIMVAVVLDNILQIWFLALFFGIALSVMSEEKQKPVAR